MKFHIDHTIYIYLSRSQSCEQHNDKAVCIAGSVYSRQYVFVKCIGHTIIFTNGCKLYFFCEEVFIENQQKIKLKKIYVHILEIKTRGYGDQKGENIEN